jgi:hypothetical protein
MIEQTSGSGDQNIHACPHRVLLLGHSDATVDGSGGDWRMNGHRVERGENLRRELTSWRNDERTCLAARFVDQMMKYWKNEGGGLAATRHRASENVAPFKCYRYCLGLNRCWSLKSQLLEAFVETGVEL